ncbi:hypothetical protein [Granulicella paludicola]|uniref:hypothetical protein n=1 Tax=Granulicella paludicola TaxID=474951 RepID=UPI0021E01E5C|nr:hypothetical protein [Granulicella paludicola]
MKSSKPPLRAGSPDKFQTPASALDPLIPYLDRKWEIWEPSCGEGNLLKGFWDRGFQASGTDIIEGYDFLSYDLGRFNAIVTNPPFSVKQKFLARCYEFGKPFALLMPLTTFDSKERQRLFHERGIQVIFMAKRVNFETPSGKGSSAWFATARFAGVLISRPNSSFLASMMSRPCSLPDETPQARGIAANLHRRFHPEVLSGRAGLHILNGTYLGGSKNVFAYIAKLKRMGMEVGDPDPRLHWTGGRTLFLECKADANKVTDVKVNMMADLPAMGFPCEVVYTLDEADAALRTHGVPMRPYAFGS